ncbi:Ferredoxin [Pyrenophora seminiperda CCB06]|uniref:Ferredoxin n=1 Tax=Pyrenophora seminiperda CCB06 TaxID=1302712 RepID=A0A3M7M1P3_9PLEO|nr:Ferredoxin [Pyrenophora seminiperda CCB06]
MFRLQPARALQRVTFTRAAIARPHFFSTTPARLAQKDAQDKDSLKPRSTEYSKSGSDDSAAHSDAAFNPNKTSPEEAERTAEREAGGKQNSLNVSPGNKDVSDPNSPDVGGNGSAPEKKSSGAGSAPKNSTG